MHATVRIEVRNVLKIAIAVALLAVVPAIAIAAGTNQVWAINCGREQYKPAKIVLSCGDAGIWLGKLTWSSWNRSTAVATGSYNENTCTPTCSAGHTVSRPVDVKLSRPKACPGRAHPAFRAAAFTFPSGSPPNAYHRFTFACPY
jgi:hypothetical protein